MAAPDAAPQRVRFLPREVFLEASDLPRARAATRLPIGRPRSSALLLAGCKDTEFSYDAHFGNRPNGAFTYYALQELEQLKDAATYRDWYRAIRTALPSTQYPQTPGLNASATQKGWPSLT
jgi:metacaspase-1